MSWTAVAGSYLFGSAFSLDGVGPVGEGFVSGFGNVADLLPNGFEITE